MFGLLKKKISDFIGKLTEKEEKKDPLPAEPVAGITPPTEPLDASKKPPTVSIPSAPEKPFVQPNAPSLPTSQKTPPSSAPTPVSSKPAVEPREEKPRPSAEKIPPAPSVLAPSLLAPAKNEPVLPSPTLPKSQKEPEAFRPQPPKVPEKDQPDPKPPARVLSLEEPNAERKLEPKIGLLSRLKSVFTNEVQIQESEITPLLDDLHWALLESDVSLDTAEHISGKLKTGLVGQKIQKDRLSATVRQAVRDVLRETLSDNVFDLVEYVHLHEKPVKILFLGPNGAGKTTTIAKVAYYLRSQGLSVVLAAGDTFRAAAIEQLAHHAEKLGVKIIKHQYAADPAAVAFDAIAHAKAHNVDVVLIDTAGRQETNFNLVKEMEKINRVVRPDLKLFVGEAVAGHALVEQAKTFHQTLQLDGIVLTKLDCDAKGGTSFSLAYEVKVPLVFMGVGQEYPDLRPFDAGWVVDNVLAE